MSTRRFPTVAEARRRYPHGSRARYCIGKCRCAKCRRAARDYERERIGRLRKPWRMRHIPGLAPRSYVVVEIATEKIVFRSSSKALAERRRDKLNATVKGDDRQLIPTTEVRDHIAWLRAQGVGLKTVARKAGIAYSPLQRLVSGEAKGVKSGYAEKILAVKPDAIRGGARVRADDSLVLIERMVAAGYRRGWIAMELGAKYPGLQIAKGAWISVRHARAIHALYLREQEGNTKLPAVKETLRLGMAEPTMQRWGKAPNEAPASRPILYSHGTRAQYLKGCRCQPCMNAHRAYEAARRQSGHARYATNNARVGARWRVYDVTTGEVILVTADQAKAAMVRDAMNSTDPIAAPNMLVDSTVVREHIEALNVAGMSAKEIARAAGMTAHYVWHIRAGRSRRVKRRIADQLLAVVDGNATPATAVPSAPTWSLLDRLAAAGFQLSWVARLLGFSKTAFARRGSRIRLGRARAVMTLYAELRERLPLVAELESLAAAA